MSDVESDVKKAALMAANGGRVPLRTTDETHARLRAEIRGAVIRAHTELGGPNLPWAPVDDRILDILDQWLTQRAGK